ncbi:MAG: recombinase family protein [Candidatus Binatia bacterium]
MHAKVTPDHLDRDAVVYIRQSSAHQIRNNRESGQRQYALAERAAALGWRSHSVNTIDEDQGRSGTGALHRSGFKKLVADIGAGQVGIVLSLEASRLARSSADWHRLVEICVITRTLLADEGAVYDPRDPNDRLLLGVKGTISEAELFTLRCRLHEGRWNKARRGELVRSLPVGYVCGEAGQVVKDPDRQVQSRLGHVFRRFGRLRVARQVVVELREQGLKIPIKVWGGPSHGRIVWKEATLSAIVRMLHNPTYAGAYVYGQFAYDPYDRYPTTGKAKPRLRGIEEWPICQQNAWPGYISWEQFLENQRVLRSNWYRSDRRGAPRRGAALLQGIAFCGQCGAKMGIQHYATKEKRAPAYICQRAYQQEGGPLCQTMSAKPVDEAVVNLFLQAVSPAKVEIALRALDELERDQKAAGAEWALQIQQAEYEVQLARRRYEAVDPENRLVADELEAEWERAIKNLETLKRRGQDVQRQQGSEFGDKDRALIRRISGDMKRVWHAATTTMEERKTLLRFLVKRVHLDGVSESGKIRIDIEWHTGAHTSTTVDRPAVGAWAPRTADAVVDRIRELLPTRNQEQIAKKLNEEGFLSAKGKRFAAQTVGYIIRSRGWGRNNGTRRASTQK